MVEQGQLTTLLPHISCAYGKRDSTSIPDDLLKRGRSYAQTRGTSLNSLIRELLDETVSNPKSAVDSMIERLRQSTGDSKGVKINREELHRY